MQPAAQLAFGDYFEIDSDRCPAQALSLWSRCPVLDGTESADSLGG
jgi:hypothetical protein